MKNRREVLGIMGAAPLLVPLARGSEIKHEEASEPQDKLQVQYGFSLGRSKPLVYARFSTPAVEYSVVAVIGEWEFDEWQEMVGMGFGRCIAGVGCLPAPDDILKLPHNYYPHHRYLPAHWFVTNKARLAGVVRERLLEMLDMPFREQWEVDAIKAMAREIGA